MPRYLISVVHAGADRIQRVLDAAARVISDTRNFGVGFTNVLHHELLYRFDVLDRVTY